MADFHKEKEEKFRKSTDRSKEEPSSRDEPASAYCSVDSFAKIPLPTYSFSVVPSAENYFFSKHALSSGLVYTYPTFLWPRTDLPYELPGCGLYELRTKVPFLKHVVYSLFKGRPVVVYASASQERFDICEAYT